MTAPYSAVKHLAFALWPHGRHEGCYFMMFTGYFDDSGHITNKKALVVCGFVATVDDWVKFDREWAAILRNPRFDLDYLHMKEFRNHRGKFEKFKDNLMLQTALFTSLYALLELRAKATFGCTVFLPDWERVNAEYMLEETYGHPFAMAGCAAINKTLRWMESKHPHDQIEFVFDQGTNGWGELLTLARKLWHGEITPIPGTPAKQTPLQAADHVAWELHRFSGQAVDTKFARKSVKTRGSLDALMARFHPDGTDNWLAADEAELRGMCLSEHYPGVIPRRERG